MTGKELGFAEVALRDPPGPCPRWFRIGNRRVPTCCNSVLSKDLLRR